VTLPLRVWKMNNMDLLLENKKIKKKEKRN